MIVSHIKIKDNIDKAVTKALELANYKKHIKGKKVFIKINALSKRVVPGQNTSPSVLEAVIKNLKNKEVYIGDANVATTKQVEESFKKWSYDKLCNKYNCTLLNLSKQPVTKVKGRIFKSLNIPKILFDVDSMITLPVLKTHNIAKLTCSLKNQWGCIPNFRQKYHLMLDQAIPEINKIIPIKFVVVDASICLEGNGPITGIPKICNSIFASPDRVAIDHLASIFANVPMPNYILNAERLGIGSTKYRILGDKITNQNFRLAIANKHPIVSIELLLRKTPFLKKIIFDTIIFKPFGYGATFYNYNIWYNFKGKKLAKRIIKNTIYEEQFKGLI